MVQTNKYLTKQENINSNNNASAIEIENSINNSNNNRNENEIRIKLFKSNIFIIKEIDDNLANNKQLENILSSLDERSLYNLFNL